MAPPRSTEPDDHVRLVIIIVRLDEGGRVCLWREQRMLGSDLLIVRAHVLHLWVEMNRLPWKRLGRRLGEAGRVGAALYRLRCVCSLTKPMS